MKKEALFRGLLGGAAGHRPGAHHLPAGLPGPGGGESSPPCVPSLVQAMGSEVAAVALQTGLSGLLGAAFGAGSVVWSLDHWSLVKQTGVYFLIGSLAMLPHRLPGPLDGAQPAGHPGVLPDLPGDFRGDLGHPVPDLAPPHRKAQPKTGIISLSSGRKRRLPPCLPAIVPQSAPGFHSPEEQPHREAGEKRTPPDRRTGRRGTA